MANKILDIGVKPWSFGTFKKHPSLPQYKFFRSFGQKTWKWEPKFHSQPLITRPLSWKFEVRFKGVSSFKGVSRVLEWSLKGVAGKFKWCFGQFKSSFKEFSRVFWECFKGISRKFQGYIKEDWRMFYGSISWFQVGFIGIWKKFKDNFREVSRVFEEIRRVYLQSF